MTAETVTKVIGSLRVNGVIEEVVALHVVSHQGSNHDDQAHAGVVIEAGVSETNQHVHEASTIGLRRDCIMRSLFGLRHELHEVRP